MRTLIYWMGVQMLIGIWLFISPFVMDFREMTAVSTNNMIFGAIVVILGLGVSFYASHEHESMHEVGPMEKKTV